MDFVAGEAIKAGDFVVVGNDGKLYRLDNRKITKIADQKFIESLKSNPAYKHINIEKELYRIDEWLKRHPGRVKTRRFIINWLMRIEVPLGGSSLLAC